MATKQWLMGCGVGCLLVVVVLVIGGSLLVNKVKDTVAEFDDVEETQRELADLYGDMEDYVLPADGRIPAARVETWLRVQEKILPESQALAASLSDVRTMEDPGNFSFRKMARVVQGIASLGADAGRWLSVRNRVLLEERMGMGEFTQLTVLIHHGWLAYPLDLTIDGDNDDDERQRRDMARDLFRSSLRAWREAAEAAGDPSLLVPAIEEQMAELALDDEYVPWTRGALPAVVTEGLEPYRDRCEAVFADVGPLLGVGAGEGEGFNFHVE